MHACLALLCWGLSEDWAPENHRPVVWGSSPQAYRSSAGAQPPAPCRNFLCCNSLLPVPVCSPNSLSLLPWWLAVTSLSSPARSTSSVSLRDVKRTVQWTFAGAGRVLSFKMTIWDQNRKWKQAWPSSWDFEQDGWEILALGKTLSLALSSLCDLGQISDTLWASVSYLQIWRNEIHDF